MASVTNVSVFGALDDDSDTDGEPVESWRRAIPKGVLVYEITGPFFFGAAETFRETLGQIASKPKVLIIRMRDVGALDSTGIHALKDVIRRTRRDGATVLLADVHTQPLAALSASPVMDELGPGGVFPSIDKALVHARGLLGVSRCRAGRGKRRP
jgi:sulfate permease, SulP family